MTFGAAVSLAFAMLTAPDLFAQSSRQSGSRSSGSSTTRQSSSSSQSGVSSRQSQSSGSSSSSRQSSVQSSSSSRQSGTTTRQSQGGTSTRQSGTTTRQSQSGTTTRQSGTTRQSESGTVTRQSGSSSRQSGTTTRQSGTATRQSSQTGTASRQSTPSVRSSSQTSDGGRASANSSNVTRGGLSSNATGRESSRDRKEAYRDLGFNYRYSDDMRVDDRHNMYRVAPRHRDPMAWDRPGHFWSDRPHYYGYRIHTPPPSWRRISHWGIDYYYYNGVYYRPYGGVYVVCRPPFGTPLEVAIDRAIMRSIRFAYYYDTYRTYETVFDYYNVIARQNLVIAQQNARLAAANRNYALNSNRALSAYELANKLGLVQSYAYANSEYFYQDGVFYTISASGAYNTIVPPAGALVTSLPDDYEIIVMGGIEYYLVDNTVYRTTVFEGEPFLEVLGQMYGSVYNQYDIYR